MQASTFKGRHVGRSLAARRDNGFHNIASIQTNAFCIVHIVQFRRQNVSISIICIVRKVWRRRRTSNAACRSPIYTLNNISIHVYVMYMTTKRKADTSKRKRKKKMGKEEKERYRQASL